jgi:hypothetical protein
MSVLSLIVLEAPLYFIYCLRFRCLLPEMEIYAVRQTLGACNVIYGQTYSITAIEAFDTSR